MRTRIGKILIANRGEIALRVIRTCRELGIRSVAVFSEADRNMPHVAFADEAFLIGPPPAAQSYLNMGAVIAAACKSGADAIHPGYGFLSENALFARRVAEAGLIFIGPPPDAIAAMGDKTAARRLVSSAGVPTVPGTDGPVSSLDEAAAFCASNGFPVLIKAAAGGGGRGMRIVRAPEELPAAFTTASSEAKASFGDARVYIEKYVSAPRHIEFQVLADAYGNVVHLGERECSIQRRHQKVIEETPSVAIDEQQRHRMGATAVLATKACGYVNAGTIEFLVDADRNFYFLEMNTRLQVEHPVTELRTGLDLVALQIAIASGEPLPFRQEDIRFRGHALECRICAEDPANNYAPSTGKIIHLRPAAGIGVRDDRGIDEGGEISVYYDSMIAKLAVWAPTRDEAITRMRRALAEYEILGVKTNVALCAFVMTHPDFVAGNFTTHFLQEHFHPADGTGNATTRALAALCALMARQLQASPLPAAPQHEGNGQSPARNAQHTGWTSQRIDAMRR